MENINSVLASAKQKICRLDPQEAWERFKCGKGKVKIIDTRDSLDQLREGIIPGSILITRNTLEWRCDPMAEVPHPDLNTNSTTKDEIELILICNEGYSTALAVLSLREIGRNRVADVRGGFKEWLAQKLPVIPITLEAIELERNKILALHGYHLTPNVSLEN